MSGLPEYERVSGSMVERGQLSAGFVRQIELTASPHLDIPFAAAQVVDIGCGYGHAVAELARNCASVVGIEPNPALARHARDLSSRLGLANVTIREQPVSELSELATFDLAILDNVLEHVEDQREALWHLSRCLKPGGVAFILVPNKLWPIEVHYGLPFLSYLPLRAANAYLRLTGRGNDYRDASYAPTYWRLRRLLAEREELDAALTLPGDISLAKGGNQPAYRAGMRLLHHFPQLWAISKAFLVTAKKRGN